VLHVSRPSHTPVIVNSEQRHEKSISTPHMDRPIVALRATVAILAMRPVGRRPVKATRQRECLPFGPWPAAEIGARGSGCRDRIAAVYPNLINSVLIRRGGLNRSVDRSWIPKSLKQMSNDNFLQGIAANPGPGMHRAFFQLVTRGMAEYNRPCGFGCPVML
jgi:hypothetical protein